MNMSGMAGRMLRLPALPRRRKAKKREILFICGHHTSLERTFGLAHILINDGSVTIQIYRFWWVCSLFIKLARKPTLDNLADILLLL